MQDTKKGQKGKEWVGKGTTQHIHVDSAWIQWVSLQWLWTLVVDGSGWIDAGSLGVTGMWIVVGAKW